MFGLFQLNIHPTLNINRMQSNAPHNLGKQFSILMLLCAHTVRYTVIAAAEGREEEEEEEKILKIVEVKNSTKLFDCPSAAFSPS